MSLYHQEYADQHKLTCHYARHHPTLLISPIKVEQVYLDPPMSIFYDVLTPSQMAKVKELGEPRVGKLCNYTIIGRATRAVVHGSR